jgi:hypothetical protein
MTALLREVAYVRSGDKGDTVNIGVIAKEPAFYEALRRSVTPDAVKALFGDWVKGEVVVYEVPNLHSLAVFMRGALGGGATRTLRLDQTGKSIGNAILRLPIQGEVPAAVRS